MCHSVSEVTTMMYYCADIAPTMKLQMFLYQFTHSSTKFPVPENVNSYKNICSWENV